MSLRVVMVFVSNGMSSNEGEEDLLAVDAERRVSTCTGVGGLRSGLGTVFTFAVGGVLSVKGGLGFGGDCVIFVTGLGNLGGGLRPLGVEVDLDSELVLRVGRAMMRNCA